MTLDRPLLTVADVAAFTGLSEYTVRQAVREGDLQASKLRGRIRIDEADLRAWVDGHRVTREQRTDTGHVAAPAPTARRGDLPTPDNVMDLIAKRRGRAA